MNLTGSGSTGRIFLFRNEFDSILLGLGGFILGKGDGVVVVVVAKVLVLAKVRAVANFLAVPCVLVLSPSLTF